MVLVRNRSSQISTRLVSYGIDFINYCYIIARETIKQIQMMSFKVNRQLEKAANKFIAFSDSI